MSSTGLDLARTKMSEAGVDPVAIETFAHYYRLLEHGETGLIPESSIEPLDMESLADVEVDDETASAALRTTAVIKLNGGLGTSMGMDRAKSLLCVRKGWSFLDVIARQVVHLRRTHDAPLPLLFMNSFRTSRDTMAALARYADLPVEGLPLEFLQNREPKLRADDLTPVTWAKDPDLEWCPPGHGDLYTALRGTGLLTTLVEQGYERVFVSNSDNLGATPDPRVAGWFARSGAPFAIEAVRRTPSDVKGGHFARRKSDDRIVLRETAQTSQEDRAALADLDRHRFCSTNNLWFDLRAMTEAIEARHGILGLPLIRNTKTVDPGDASSPEVIQIETAMGAAIEVFEGATTIEVGRDRFVPVKTTNDLLVLRSDVYDVGKDFVLSPVSDQLPFVDLDSDYYKLVPEFERRFPEGAPSLREATSLKVQGDWTFGREVKVKGDVSLETAAAARVETGSVWSMTDAPVSVEEHRDRILSAISPLPAFDQPLMEAFGLAAAEEVRASVALPSFDNSAMDGYAVREADVAHASLDSPIHLPVVGEIGAGQATLLAMSPGTAVKIMTGAPVPAGADAIVPYEWTDRGVAQVVITQAPEPGQHVRPAGEDVAVGDLVVTEGTVLGPRQIGLLAAVGRASVRSRPRPRVVVLSTGSELREPGTALGRDSIYDGNSFLLAAAARQAGAIAYRVGIVPDDPRAFLTALQDQLVRADLVVTSGGVSMGDYDVVKEALSPLGTVWFGGVAMQPGKPQGFGTVGEDDIPIITLPGNPVSSYISFEMFVLPAIRKLMGRTTFTRPTADAVLTRGLRSPEGRRQYARGTLSVVDGRLAVTPVGPQGSHMIGDLAESDALVVVPESVTSLDAGETVSVVPLDEDF